MGVLSETKQRERVCAGEDFVGEERRKERQRRKSQYRASIK